MSPAEGGDGGEAGWQGGGRQPAVPVTQYALVTKRAQIHNFQEIKRKHIDYFGFYSVSSSDTTLFDKLLTKYEFFVCQ